MPIDITWTQLTDVPAPVISGWQYLGFFGALLLLITPLVLWKLRWAAMWRWRRSVIFFVGWFCAYLPAVVGLTTVIGDTHAEIGADKVMAQLLPTRTPITRTTWLEVAPSDHATGSTLDVPYQGDQFGYQVNFTALTAHDDTLRCHAEVFLFRQESARGRPAPVFARAVGFCNESSTRAPHQ